MMHLANYADFTLQSIEENKEVFQDNLSAIEPFREGCRIIGWEEEWSSDRNGK